MIFRIHRPDPDQRPITMLERTMPVARLKARKVRYLTGIAIASLLSGCGGTSPSTPPAGSDSPAVVTDRFMHELFKSDRDLLRDEEFKKEYFSQNFRRAADKAREHALAHPPPKDEPPPSVAGEDRFNTTIFNAWDIPTSYTMGAAEQAATTAAVDVTYLWGPDTQYSGDTRVTSVRLVAEGGSWRIDDLVTRKGEFVPEGSLRASLEKTAKKP